MVSADSSVEPRALTVPLTSPALTLTATAAQNKFPKYSISISERSIDIIGELELTGKTALYVISQG